MKKYSFLPFLTLLLMGQGADIPPTSPKIVGEFRAGSGYLNGYLTRQELPNSLMLLPKPPQENSPQAHSDLAIHKATRVPKESPRWDYALKDTNLKFPQAAETFTCALDIPISQEETPHLNMILRRTIVDAGLSTYAAKDHYKRLRPFVVLEQSTCNAKEEATLTKDGSYPSGHAAVGWAWALILSELAPEKTDALLARGYAYGQSRVVCGVHWQSDVDAGRVMGSAAVAKLHSNELFKKQMALAKQEIDAARTKKLATHASCPRELEALK